MTIPPGAIFEAVTPDPGVAVWDVSHLLPTKKGRPQPERKPGARIVRCYVHKSGGEGGPGYAGILASARYVVTHRMFPGMPYTLWASTVPDVDADGRLVLYRGAADDRRTWHTGGVCNDHGIALALQGNLSNRDLTAAQARVGAAALSYVITSRERYPDMDENEPVGTHSDAKRFGAPKNKTICPGRYAETWLMGVLA